jgi:hypothetical protein
MTAVEWRTTDARGSVTLDDAWHDAAARAWLPTHAARVIVHVVTTSARGLVLETARSLIEFLQRTMAPHVELVMAGDVPEWPGVERLDLAAHPRHRVDVACLRDGALVPEAWFDDVFVATVVDYAPDRRLGIRGVLAAQAELLAGAGALDLDRIFVAHRLLRSNLCVGCGTEVFDDPASRTWWAIAQDDVALERAVAWQAGVEPDALPVFRHFAHHETRGPEELRKPNESLQLRGYVEPRARVTVARIETTALERGRRMIQDVRLGIDNLRRLPNFLERRAPAVARLWGAR